MKDVAAQLLDIASRLLTHEEAELPVASIGPVVTGANVGLTAGVAKDGETVLIDKVIPAEIETSRGFWNVHESIELHERCEHAIMDAGYDYPEAHRLATEIEHSIMRIKGFDPIEIEALLEPFIDMAAHEARARKTDPEIDAKPYVDSGETGMLAGNADDPREYFDCNGNCYVNADTIHLLGEHPAMLVDGEEGSAVIEPHNGQVLAIGRTRHKAKANAEDYALKRGLRRLAEDTNHEPMSQAQLKEKYSASR